MSSFFIGIALDSVVKDLGKRGKEANPDKWEQIKFLNNPILLVLIFLAALCYLASFFIPYFVEDATKASKYAKYVLVVAILLDVAAIGLSVYLTNAIYQLLPEFEQKSTLIGAWVGTLCLQIGIVAGWVYYSRKKRQTAAA